jgi:hypothetical protein
MTLQLRKFNLLEYLKRKTRNEGSKCITQSNLTIAHRFFLKRFIAQKIQRDTQGYKIVPLTLRSLN